MQQSNTVSFSDKFDLVHWYSKQLQLLEEIIVADISWSSKLIFNSASIVVQRVFK